MTNYLLFRFQKGRKKEGHAAGTVHLRCNTATSVAYRTENSYGKIRQFDVKENTATEACRLHAQPPRPDIILPSHSTQLATGGSRAATILGQGTSSSPAVEHLFSSEGRVDLRTTKPKHRAGALSCGQRSHFCETNRVAPCAPRVLFWWAFCMESSRISLSNTTKLESVQEL